MSEQTQLEPCPFCGSSAKLVRPTEDDNDIWWRVVCTVDECTGSNTNGWNLKSAAIKHWNTRTSTRRFGMEEAARIAEAYKADEPETVRMIAYRVAIAAAIRAAAEDGT